MLQLLVWGPHFKEQGYQWKDKTPLLTPLLVRSIPEEGTGLPKVMQE